MTAASRQKTLREKTTSFQQNVSCVVHIIVHHARGLMIAQSQDCCWHQVDIAECTNFIDFTFSSQIEFTCLSPITGLPTTKLATYLEDRINTFLRTMEADTGVVTIRVVSSSDKILDTRMLMRDRFQGDFPEQFPYRTKAMFVFEEIDGVDVCFFGMHVQEYGSDCQAPNTRYM